MSRLEGGSLISLVNEVVYTVWHQPWGDYFLDRRVDRYVTLTRLGRMVFDNAIEAALDQEIDEIVERWTDLAYGEIESDESTDSPAMPEEIHMLLPSPGGAVDCCEANELLAVLFGLR